MQTLSWRCGGDVRVSKKTARDMAREKPNRSSVFFIAKDFCL